MSNIKKNLFRTVHYWMVCPLAQAKGILFNSTYFFTSLTTLSQEFQVGFFLFNAHLSTRFQTHLAFPKNFVSYYVYFLWWTIQWRCLAEQRCSNWMSEMNCDSSELFLLYAWFVLSFFLFLIGPHLLNQFNLGYCLSTVMYACYSKNSWCCYIGKEAFFYLYKMEIVENHISINAKHHIFSLIKQQLRIKNKYHS